MTHYKCYYYYYPDSLNNYLASNSDVLFQTMTFCPFITRHLLPHLPLSLTRPLSVSLSLSPSLLYLWSSVILLTYSSMAVDSLQIGHLSIIVHGDPCQTQTA